jgi:hypothetical protein
MSHHALKFEPDKTNGSSARRNRNAKCVFNGLAVGDRVGETVVSRDALCDYRTAHDGNALEKLLRALVCVEVVQFKVENRITHHAESKVAGFDDSSMNGTDRNFAYSDTLRLQESVFTGMNDKRPQVRMTVNLDSVLIVQLAFVPGGRWHDLCGRRNCTANERICAVILAIQVHDIVNVLCAIVSHAAKDRDQARVAVFEKP